MLHVLVGIATAFLPSLFITTHTTCRGSWRVIGPVTLGTDDKTASQSAHDGAERCREPTNDAITDE